MLDNFKIYDFKPTKSDIVFDACTSASMIAIIIPTTYWAIVNPSVETIAMPIIFTGVFAVLVKDTVESYKVMKKLKKEDK